MKKLMFISVRGKRHDWMFDFYGNPNNIKEWQADGLEVSLVEKRDRIPAAIAELGLGRQWYFLYDFFSLKWWK